VRYGYNGNPSYNTETIAPYSFCRNDKADFFSCEKLGLGSHTVTVTPRNRKGQAITSVTVKFTIVESDVTPPTLVSLKALTPTTVDVSNGSKNITMELTFWDDSSGFMGGVVGYDTPFQFGDFFWTVGDIQTQTPKPGLAAGGLVTYVINMRIRRYQRPGTFPLNVFFNDYAFNFNFYDGEQLAELRFPSNITIINTNVDTMPPKVINFTAVSSLTIPSSNTTFPFVEFDVVVQDDLSGIDYGWVRSKPANYSGDFYPSYGEFGKGPTFSNSLNHDVPESPAGVPIKYRAKLEFDTELPPGAYFLELTVFDGIRNRFNLNSTELKRLGFPSVVTLV
jgi:hypothetical protein